MDTESVFNSLQKRKNSLKFKLMHSKLKHGTYSFDNSRNDVLTVLNHYKKYGSFFKVSSIVGLIKTSPNEYHSASSSRLRVLFTPIIF